MESDSEKLSVFNVIILELSITINSFYKTLNFPHLTSYMGYAIIKSIMRKNQRGRKREWQGGQKANDTL